MPKRTRDAVKQDIVRANDNIEAAKDKLGRWIEVYKDYHPEIGAALHVAIENLALIQEFVSKINEQI